MPELRRLLIADDPNSWERAGFSVENGATAIGGIAIRFVPQAQAGDRRGIIGWEMTEIEDGSIDGIMSILTDTEPAAPIEHPNRTSRIDHVVVMTPDLDRTVGSLRAFGFSPRRTRDVPGTDRRQVFLWAGETILEVVGSAASTGSAPASIWGLALTTDDLDAAVEALGDRLTEPKPAVQPGRRIATIKTKDLDITPALAMMTPHDPDAPRTDNAGTDNAGASNAESDG